MNTLNEEIRKLERDYQKSFGMPKGMRLDEWFRKQGMNSMAEAFKKDYQKIDKFDSLTQDKKDIGK